MIDPYSDAARQGSVSIYIESSCLNVFRVGWGAVVAYADGRSEEHHDDTIGETAPRALLLGCIAVLNYLPEGTPVTVFCAQEFLPRWTLPKLKEMQADGFRSARKKKLKNLDLVEKLAVAADRHVHIQGIFTRRSDWTNHHFRADNLARDHGVGEVTKRPNV